MGVCLSGLTKLQLHNNIISTLWIIMAVILTIQCVWEKRDI